MKFYYAQSNDAYVEVSDAEYVELESRIDFNSELLDKYPDKNVFEMCAENKQFAENEKYIQKVLQMSDEQFANIVLY